MGQVRDRFSKSKYGVRADVAGLTEWISRKVTNHDPMSQRDEQEGGRQFKAKHQNERGRPKPQRRKRVEHEDGANVVLYHLANGKHFRLTVEEVAEDGVTVIAA